MKLSSRLGFILLSAGCAIGIGNVWRFPYIAGQSGGGAFVLVYLFFLALLGIPVLAMEFACGRASGRSITRLHAELTPERHWWSVHGIAGLVGCTVLMAFYTTVAGWMVLYFLKTVWGEFSGQDAAGVENAFGRMLADPWAQAMAMFGVCISCAVVCALGIQKGLERVSKWMMLALLALIVILAANSISLRGAGEGVRFLLWPDFARMQSVGVATVIANAMNQAFFTLSLGVGSMAIFSSYIDKRRALVGEAVDVAILDTVVAVCAGLIILPACFAYGVKPGQGPGLVFVTLPNVFNHMALGRLWGSLFFIFMSFAALTTVLAVFECIIAGLSDLTDWNRRRACGVTAVAMPLLSLPCVLGFNIWAKFCPFGAGSSVLDLEDFIVSDMLLPLGSLAFAVYCTSRFGWGWKSFLAECNSGEGLKMPKWARAYCAWVLPAIIAAIFVIGIVRRFG